MYLLYIDKKIMSTTFLFKTSILWSITSHRLLPILLFYTHSSIVYFTINILTTNGVLPYKLLLNIITGGSSYFWCILILVLFYSILNKSYIALFL